MKLFSSMLFCVAFLFLWSCSGTASRDGVNNSVTTSPSPSVAATPVDVMATGRRLYNENCAGCHKENGTGGEMQIEGRKIDPDDLTSAKIKKFPDDKLERYIYNGIEDEGMPAFKDKLSEAQIREIVRYVRSELQGIQSAEPTKGPGVN